MARQIVKEWEENGLDCFTEIVTGSDNIKREFSSKIYNGVAYGYETPEQVMYILDNARTTHQRIRLFYGYDDGKDWHEEHDVIGYIGRSTGQSIPLIIHNSRSIGGGAILDRLIIKIVDCKSKRVLYQHATYNGGTYEVHKVENLPGYVEGVWIDGSNYANFHKAGQAERWAGYMKGERMAK